MADEYESHLKRANNDFKFKIKLNTFLREVQTRRKDLKASAAKERERLEDHKRYERNLEYIRRREIAAEIQQEMRGLRV